MDTDITGTENTFLEKLAPSKTCKPPTVAMTFTTHLNQFWRDLKDRMIEGYKFWNTWNGTRNNKINGWLFSHEVLPEGKESPLSYLLLQIWKAIIHHLPLDMTVEDISNGLEDLGFNVINVRQMMSTRTAPKKPHGTFPLFLVTLSKIPHFLWSVGLLEDWPEGDAQ